MLALSDAGPGVALGKDSTCQLNVVTVGMSGWEQPARHSSSSSSKASSSMKQAEGTSLLPCFALSFSPQRWPHTQLVLLGFAASSCWGQLCCWLALAHCRRLLDCSSSCNACAAVISCHLHCFSLPCVDGVYSRGSQRPSMCRAQPSAASAV
jgi:hypothetical protein